MLYVAYGSNMNIEQMRFRCPNSKVIGNGKLVGWKLVFNMHLDVINTNNRKDIVPVVIWDINKKDWDRLDMYEGYPNYYVKEFVNVKYDNGKNKKAVVYVMADNMKGIAPPMVNYFKTCEQGYIDNNINLDYLYEALNYSIENTTDKNKYSIKGMVL